MKSHLSVLVSCPKLAVLAALILGSLTAGAFPTITNVVETGGENETVGTVTAKWTGVTFVNGVANQPLPNTPADAPYTVGLFGDHAPCFVDRNHRWTNASPTIPVLIPPYLVGQEYIMIGNDNRNRTALRLDVSVATAVHVYLLIDNRLNSTTEPMARNNDPPTFGPSAMQWVIDEGWVPVTNGLNRAANPAWPDEIGVDESADNDHDQWSSIYYKGFPAGTFQLKQADNTGRNMYGVVIASAAPPVTPANLTATGGDGKVTLNWTAAGGATGYVVKRSLTAGGPYEVLATNTTTRYIDLAVVNDTTYYYVVSAINVAGESADSNEAVGTPKAAPANVTAVGGAGQAQVSWDALPGAASYTVSRSTTSGGPYTSVAAGITGISYVDTSVEGGRTYYYVVTAQLTAGGDSGQSDEASALTAPSAPTLTVSPWAATALLLTWTIGNQTVTGYAIEQSTDGVNFVPLATVAATPRNYVDAGLMGSTTYYYRIQGTNASGMSDYSNIASGTTPASGFNVNFANALNGTPANNPAPTPPGYVQDVGLPFGDRGNGLNYGWSADITIDSRWRMNANSPDLRWDTFNHLQKPQVLPTAVWEIEIPNGFYSIYTVAGDPTAVDSVFQFDIEGFITGTYVPVTGAWWREFTAEVPVEDGKLTVKSGPRAANNKINFIDIYPATPVGPTITTQPQDAVGEEYHATSLSVGASGSFRLVYQWYRDGTPVPDGTNATLEFPHVRMSDAGQYTVVITNWGGTVTSGGATLTVNADTTAPTITGAESLDGETIDVCFSEELENSVNQVGDNFNYTVNGMILVSNVVVRPGVRSVILQLSEAITGPFTLEVNTVNPSHTDLAGNPMPATTLNRIVGGFAGDVGGPTHPGRHFSCGDEIEIVGGGADVWGANDQFYLISRPVNGNFDAQVRVTSLTGSNAITKAVLVARENNDANARAYHISVNPTPPGRNQLELGLRSTTGGATASWGGTFVPAGIPNSWMRITRVGNTFTGYRSTNGMDWIPMGTNTMVFPAGMVAGIGVTAHNDSQLAKGTFSNFRIVSEPVRPTMNNLTFGGGQFGLSFASENGFTYHIDYSDSLSPPDWRPLTSVPGDGTVKTISDPGATAPMRFYRIRVE